MKKSPWLSAALVVAGLGTAAVASANEELHDYRGDIGETRRIGMTLIFDGEAVRGSYFDLAEWTDTALVGTYTDGSHLRLEARATDGAVVARVDGRFLEFTDQDPRKRYGAGRSKLDREVLVGTWQALPEGEPLPLYLGLEQIVFRQPGTGRYVTDPTADAEIERSAQAFWRAAVENDRAAVATMIAYPITVELDGRERRLDGPEAFLAVYTELFTPEFRAEISEMVPHNMFVNHSGIMLGAGEIWFDIEGRVTSIHP